MSGYRNWQRDHRRRFRGRPALTSRWTSPSGFCGEPWRSVQDHRTNPTPVARMASSRRFSRTSVSRTSVSQDGCIVWVRGSPTFRPYFTAPSNSPTSLCSRQKKSVRPRSFPPGDRNSCCSSGAGNPYRWRIARENDSPGDSERASANSRTRNARLRLAESGSLPATRRRSSLLSGENPFNMSGRRAWSIAGRARSKGR